MNELDIKREAIMALARAAAKAPRKPCNLCTIAAILSEAGPATSEFFQRCQPELIRELCIEALKT